MPNHLIRGFPRSHYDKALTERWNIAMSRAGFAGSEFIDEPERIAEDIRRMRTELHTLRIAEAKHRRETR